MCETIVNAHAEALTIKPRGLRLLRADLRGPAKRQRERLLQGWLALDLAADVADDSARRLRRIRNCRRCRLNCFAWAYRPAIIAAAMATRGLPQRDAVPCCASRLSPLMAACSSLASVGKVMAFGCTVVSTVTRLGSWPRNAPASCARGLTPSNDFRTRGVSISQKRADSAPVIMTQATATLDRTIEYAYNNLKSHGYGSGQALLWLVSL